MKSTRCVHRYLETGRHNKNRSACLSLLANQGHFTHATQDMKTRSVATLKYVHVTLGVKVFVSPGNGHEIERTASTRPCVEGRDLVRVDVDPGNVRVLTRRGPCVVWGHGVQLDPAVSVTSERLVRERNGRMVESPGAY